MTTADENARRRERRATDPDFRERDRARSAANYAKHRAARLAAQKARHRERMASDPEYAARYRAMKAERERKRRAKIATEAGRRAALEAKREQYAARKLSAPMGAQKPADPVHHIPARDFGGVVQFRAHRIKESSAAPAPVKVRRVLALKGGKVQAIPAGDIPPVKLSPLRKPRDPFKDRAWKIARAAEARAPW